MNSSVKIAVLVSGGGTNLQALIDSEKRGELKSGTIALVISNKEGAFALERAKNAGIPSEVVFKKELGAERFESELHRLVADYKIEWFKQAAQYMKPDIVFYHDDWGTKQNVFLPPRVWRELIKPLQKEIVQTAHDCGIMFMHHADCVCQPLTPDMVEIGIDLWQGAIPQNDILEIQRMTDGKLPMIGGIDGPKIDIENITEEEIRAEVRRAFDTYCPGARFYPSIANGRCFRPWNNEIYMDELAKYGREYAKTHPLPAK